MLTPRPYQRAAVDSVYEYFTRSDGNPLIVMPTGSGKSLVQALFQFEVLQRWPGQRIVLLSHVKELLEQNAEKIRTLWPDAPMGIYSAGLHQRVAHRPMTIASIQSIHRRAALIGRVDLVIIDEAHLVPADAQTMYRRFLDDLRAINPALKVIGMSATPYRLDSGYLHDGDGAIFTDICFDLPVTDLIRDGYLCPLVSKAGAHKIDLEGVRTRGGEFVPADIEKAVHKDGVLEAAIEEIIAYGRDRKSWLVFCNSVENAGEVAEMFSARGYPMAPLSGKTPRDQRDRLIKRFRAGEIHLSNVNVLTTGFDAPSLDLIAMLRPTKSTSLFVQMLGRGMRIAPRKQDCLVLDYAGNVERHGPVDDLRIHWQKKGNGAGKGEAPGGKECEQCSALVSIFARACPQCGAPFDFKPAAPKHGATASDAALLTTQIEPEWCHVDQVFYALHTKKDRPPSVRVEYVCGVRVFTEWVCVEHERGSYAHQSAQHWFKTRGIAMPRTAQEAIERVAEYPFAERILVRREGKFDRVVSVELKSTDIKDCA